MTVCCFTTVGCRRRQASHLALECPKRILDCSLGGEGCGARFAAEDEPRHVRDVCPKRTVTCECGMRLVAETLGDHKILDCDAFLRYCSLGCGAKLRQMDMKAHQETECVKRHLMIGKRVACPLGCGKSDMRFHEASSDDVAHTDLVS